MTDFAAVAGLLEGIKPEPRLKVSQWAEQFRELKARYAAEPGPWSNARTPYLVEIMDALSSSSNIQKIVIMKAARIGMTEAMVNFIGYTIDNDPGPTAFVLSTDELLKKYSKIVLASLVNDTPSILEKIGPNKSRDGKNSMNLKFYPGGVLMTLGANSPSNFRALTVRDMILDEVDAYPMNLGDEGDPVSLAEGRTQTFGKKKRIVILSTPVLQGASIINREYLDTEQRKFFVPFPCCGAFQTLERDNLRWKWGHPETARMQCKECGEMVGEQSKRGMLKFGQWRATKPKNEKKGVRGYFINGMYSPLGLTWEDVASRVEKCENEDGTVKDLEKKKTLVNLVDGLPFKGEGEAPPWRTLFERREDYLKGTVPTGVDFLTVGIDTQNDRFEIEVAGWGPRMERWSVDFKVIPGDPKDPETWTALEEYLETGWETEAGELFHASMVCHDAFGQRTRYVYEWYDRKGDKRRYRLIKGSNRPTMIEIFKAPTVKKINKAGKRIGKGRVWELGVNKIKEAIYADLSKVLREPDDDGIQEIPPGYYHFPADYDEAYFKGLTAEKMRVDRDKNGYAVTVWELPSHARNEPLDCCCYANAAAAMLGAYSWRPQDWSRQVAAKCLSPRAPVAPPQQPKKKPKGDSFWGKGGGFW